jgi:hypothetical protein
MNLFFRIQIKSFTIEFFPFLSLQKENRRKKQHGIMIPECFGGTPAAYIFTLKEY